MDNRHRTIRIREVGQTSDHKCSQVGRGVFNFDSVLDYLSQPVDGDLLQITIDLTRVGWIRLFDWWLFTCILHSQLQKKPHLKIYLDFVGRLTSGLISYRDCSDYLAKRVIAPRFAVADYHDSYVVHRVLNFIKSLEGHTGFENVARGQIVLAGLSRDEARRPGWYRQDPSIENSVILPRTNIEAREMCLLFASRHQIESWREAMAIKRVPNSAVFKSEEFWRVLCHELARNVFEHAKTDTGFISGRVVLPIEGKLPRWCRDVYDPIVLSQLETARQHGFVELCVSDAGIGIPGTLEQAYRNRYWERHREHLIPDAVLHHEDLLKFAFDELGTSKDADHSWITNRHALGHTLFVVAKYAGVLTVRSGNAALTYCANTGAFKRCPNQLGFEPTAERTVYPALPGTHIQLLIPLTAQSYTDNLIQQKPYPHLPPSFHVDHQHPVGPLIPLREKLGAFGMYIAGTDVSKFKESIRALAKEILQGRYTRNEPLVFDFSEVDWTPAQFETFLYLMQNVLVNRLVLIAQVPHEFAELVNAQEDEDRPTYLPDAIQEEIQQRELDREFTEGKFLETYSGLGALLLGLGPDRREYLFGVRGRDLRVALLELINNEQQTIQGLCESHALDEQTLEVVLNRASLLFKLDNLNRWDSVFVRGAPDRDDLEVQRLRATTKHFDIVAKRCGTWRGVRTGQTTPHPGTVGDRFYLPTENVIYTEFLETSRIVARERYVIEIAERLIYRLCQGLDAKGLTLNDVDILACSTTPTVMLAEAIRRAWPVEPVGTGKRPVVIDYGPSLFSGADPAHIPVTENSKRRAVVVHDLFDQGTLSEKVVTLVEWQGSEVLFVLTFIKFLHPSESAGNESMTFPPIAGWRDNHPIVGKPVHAMIGVRRPERISMEDANDWGANDQGKDYVVDPRSLRPVLLPSLRLESDYSEERSLTNRDLCLEELDRDEEMCRLAAGHFVYGHRHFAVVVDVRGLLTGAIGHKIIKWLAALCCGDPDRNAPWKGKPQDSCPGEVSAILIPLHSQIYYILPGLQVEVAQRGRRVPHFYLDATSFGGGVETYDIPYQLLNQIEKAAKDIKTVVDEKGVKKSVKNARVKERQLRLLFVDDAIFSGRTLQTVLDSLAKHVAYIKKKVYVEEEKYNGPIGWIRAFAVLNELPAAKSALWHKLSRCSASSNFRFDDYAPFIGAATFSAEDCPACREAEQLQHLLRRVQEVSANHAIDWIRGRKKALAPMTTEAPSFRKTLNKPLPEPIDVLASPGAPKRYKPYHTDSAIWRFYELMYLSYPLRDVLLCLQTTRKAGLAHPDFRNEYARFRLAVYDWCVQNWHQVMLYHAEQQVLDELRAEVEDGEPIFVEVIYRLSGITAQEMTSENRNRPVIEFVKWAIDTLAIKESDRRKMADKITLDLDTAMTLLFFALSQSDLDKTKLLTYLKEKQTPMPKNSFLAHLYMRLTRPKALLDPNWALTTIAETCYRGCVGDTPEERLTVDHDLLPRLVAKVELDPQNEERRRRLEGSLESFIVAVENLNPYFDDNLLPQIYRSACQVRKWLCKPVSEAIVDLSPVLTLSSSIHDYKNWRPFEESCHMLVDEFRVRLKDWLDELSKDEKEGNFHQDNLIVDVDEKVRQWCLMTNIPRLKSYISNIAINPMKTRKPISASRVIIAPSQEPQLVTIEVFTYFGNASDAYKVVVKSRKIALDKDRLKLFGVQFDEPEVNAKDSNEGLRFSLIVPVGFQV